MAKKKEGDQEELQHPFGRGLDCGTMNLVGAKRTAEGVETNRMRDLFLDLPISAEKMLRMGKFDYMKRDDEILILGDTALKVANVFGKEARRPLSDGLVSPSEIDSLEVLGVLIRHVLGEPETMDEICYYSVPAVPIDQPEKDIVYHEGVLGRIVSECGFQPIPSNEAMAIIFSETADEMFSGLALSFGSGLTNVALAINTIEGLSFSVAKAGDWIDRGAAQSVGSTRARICALKEQGVDLNNPTNREEEAISFYYKNLIEYVLDQITQRFMRVKGQFALPEAIPLIVSGGTSLAQGFLEFFQGVFDTKRKRFPIEIKEIRQAKEPLNAVAHGLLIQALQEYAED